MRVRILAAAVLALAIMGGDAVVVRADGPPSATRRPPRSGPANARGEQAPARWDARQQGLLDQLDDARINRDLQEMEVAADRAQIEKMMTVLRETELASLQRSWPAGVIGGNDPAEHAANIEKYKHKLDRVCADFVIKSKELSRERRRVAELEAELGLTAAAPSAAPVATAAPARAGYSLADAERGLDLILRGVESWQRANPPAPDGRSSPPPAPGASPTPEDRPLKDAERLLDLLRRGMESFRRDPSAAPEERSGPKSKSDQSLSKDAEQLLDLVRRGVDAWQGR